MSKHLGGMEAKAVYVDTEGSFCAERLAQVAQATKRQVAGALKAAGKER